MRTHHNDTEPSSRSPSPDNKPRLKRPTHVAAWWARFHRLSLSDLLSLPRSTQALMAQSPRSVIASLDLFGHDLLAPHAHLTSQKQTQILGARILFMYETGVADTLRIIMHVFFFAVTYHADPDRWRVDFQARATRLTHLAPRYVDALYTHFVAQFPSVAVARGEFGALFRTWRWVGSVYVFIAARLGWGALLYLQQWILPSRCWGASKGGEKGKVSESALQHLVSIGLRELCEEQGANQWVGAVLGEMGQGFGTFGFGDLDVGAGERVSPDV
jgi:hypothetical protein